MTLEQIAAAMGNALGIPIAVHHLASDTDIAVILNKDSGFIVAHKASHLTPAHAEVILADAMFEYRTQNNGIR